jgi:hypothetical protein
MIIDWIKELFDASGFLTLGQCGPWSESLKHIYITSRCFISLAYVFMAICLILIWKKRRCDMEYGWILLCFAAFIAACGLTHICDVAVFWWPGYRLFALVRSVTAILSVVTAAWLPWVTKLALKLLTPERFQRITLDLEDAIKLKDKAINDLNETVSALHRQLNHLERMRRTGLWVAEQETALRELKTALDSSFATEASP